MPSYSAHPTNMARLSDSLRMLSGSNHSDVGKLDAATPYGSFSPVARHVLGPQRTSWDSAADALFDALDLDADGRVTREEFEKAARSGSPRPVAVIGASEAKGVSVPAATQAEQAPVVTLPARLVRAGLITNPGPVTAVQSMPAPKLDPRIPAKTKLAATRTETRRMARSSVKQDSALKSTANTNGGTVPLTVAQMVSLTAAAAVRDAAPPGLLTKVAGVEQDEQTLQHSVHVPSLLPPPVVASARLPEATPPSERVVIGSLTPPGGSSAPVTLGVYTTSAAASTMAPSTGTAPAAEGSTAGPVTVSRTSIAPLNSARVMSVQELKVTPEVGPLMPAVNTTRQLAAGEPIYESSSAASPSLEPPLQNDRWSSQLPRTATIPTVPSLPRPPPTASPPMPSQAVASWAYADAAAANLHVDSRYSSRFAKLSGCPTMAPQDLWLAVGAPAVRVEPHWREGQWWLTAPVDFRGLEKAGASVRYDPNMVDFQLRQLELEGQLPPMPTPSHWRDSDSCPIS